jgi:hypothetical protein
MNMLKELFRVGSAIEPEAAEQILVVRLGEKHCCFAITDKSGDLLLKLGYYATDPGRGNPLPALWELHPELNNAFYRSSLCYDYTQSTLVEQSMYRKEESRSLLDALYGLSGTESIIVEQVQGWQIYNLYAIPADVQDWVNRKFSHAKYWHQYTVAIRNCRATDPGGHLLVDFRADEFSVVAAAENKLLLMQTYFYSTPEDVLYYLLKICHETGLSQQEARVSVSGLIDKNSALYKELYQYFIYLTFREAGWKNDEQDYPAHFFTSLNDQVRCVL